ncbi:MAG: UDP-N-acetyl-D-mannosamine dehydrogenase [Armatimonadota bacterium]
MNKVCVLGLGYIGLPAAALISSKGIRVVGVDINPDIVKKVSEGRVHFEEPDLDGLVIRAVTRGMLTAQLTPCPADVYIIAVPTPINEDKTADLRAVKNATESIVEHLRPGSLVILESTVPPGTTEELCLPILEKSGLTAGKDFYLSFCPERVLPGKIVAELVTNDRVLGGLNRASAEKAASFYRRFVRGNLYLTNLKTAETVKLIENSFRDVNIAFANEVSLIADELEIDVWEVISLANKHPRVNILNPGPGVGGHCIAVDPWFLVQKMPGITSLISAARRRNDSMPDHVVAKVEAVAKPGARVACLGAAYKANVGDVRESPAIEIIKKLIGKGYEVSVVDPHVTELGDIQLVSLEEALQTAECVVLLVDHSEFVSVNYHELIERLGTSRVIDTRGMWRDTH